MCTQGLIYIVHTLQTPNLMCRMVDISANIGIVAMSIQAQ